MKLKTKGGKYFNEVGSRKSLATAFFAVILLKMVQLDFFSLLVGTIIFSATTGIIIYFSDKREWFSTLGLKIGAVFKKIFHFYIQNWVPVTFTILTLFTIYWFGIRPVAIRKGCSVVRWTEPATLAEPASANWPECQSKGNPFDTENLMRASSQPQNCYPSKPTSPERNMERKAHDAEYKTCLRDNGI